MATGKRLLDEGKLVEDGFERGPLEPDVEKPLDEVDESQPGSLQGTDVTGFAYADPGEVGMKLNMETAVVGPPAYGSPDPATSAGRLVPLRDHPLSAERLPEGHPAAISEDFAKDLLEGEVAAEFGREGTHHGPPSLTDLERDSLGQGGYDNMNVADLKGLARQREIEGFSSMNKQELIAANEEYDETQRTNPPAA